MEPLTDKILEAYAGISYVPLRLAALTHTIRVMDAMALLWPGREGQLAALLHDYARFLHNAGTNHARLSAAYAKSLLSDEEEDLVLRVCTAIANHSSKDRVDDPFSEALKDADVLARWLEDAGYAHPRLEKMKGEGFPFPTLP